MLFLENVSIKVSLTTTGKTPLKAFVDSAGFDLYADETVLVSPKNQSWVRIIYSRSGLASKGIIVLNDVVDPGFCGEIKVLLFNLSCQEYTVEKGNTFCSNDIS